MDDETNARPPARSSSAPSGEAANCGRSVRSEAVSGMRGARSRVAAAGLLDECRSVSSGHAPADPGSLGRRAVDMEVLSVRSSPRFRLAAVWLLSLCAVLLATAPAEASRTDCSPEPGWPGQDAAAASQVVTLVNQYRASQGLSQLSMSQSLTNAAAWKASQLAVDGPAGFDHTDYVTGRSPATRLQVCGYGDSFGENIALGQASAQAVMTAWLNSPGHKANLDYPYWTAIGVGAALGASGYGWVQDFGISNPDPIVSPVASLAPTPSTTAPVAAVPLASPIVAQAAPAAAPPPAVAASVGVRIMVRPRPRTRKRTARIRWHISGPARRVRCALNGRVLQRCGSTGRTLHVHRGRHTFRVTVSGPAGTDTKMIRWRVLRGR